LLIEQLKPGGILILPLGSPYGNQTLVRITKDKTGEITSESLLPVRFVPMLGQIIKDKRQGTK
jgi:protein-L-isoaspartate(D-aspartate) O-methyltransferase